MFDFCHLESSIGHFLHLVADDECVDGTIDESVGVDGLDVASDGHFGEVSFAVEGILSDACDGIAVAFVVGYHIGNVHHSTADATLGVLYDLRLTILEQGILDVVDDRVLGI